MNNVVNLKNEETLDQTAGKIRKWIFDAARKEILASQYRLCAGAALIAVRPKVEAAGFGWEQWCKEKVHRDQRDIRKLMALARADDPEAALIEENARRRDRAAAGKSLQEERARCPETVDCVAATEGAPERPPAPVLAPALHTPDTRRYDRLVSAWDDCTGEEQSRFLDYIHAENRRHA